MSANLVRRAASGDFSPEVASWLQRGFALYQAGEEMNQAFGLDRVSLIRKRNAALLEAAKLLEDGRRPWHVAGLLAASIQRFEVRVAPALEKDPSISLSPVDDAIRRAMETDCQSRVPRTQRTLFELIR